MSNDSYYFQPGEKFHNLCDRPLKRVSLSKDKSTVTFSFLEGPDAVFGVEGDCCSHSWIEHVEFPGKKSELKDVCIVDVEEVNMDTEEVKDDDDWVTEHIQTYEARFKTPKGVIVLEYRNSSNGYYGGNIVRIS